METPLERLKRKVMVENLWLHVLKMLKTKEMIGYEIRNELKKKYGFWCGNVTAYKVLYGLEAGGYVSRNGKKRYKVTKKGAKELEKAGRFIKSLAGSR